MEDREDLIIGLFPLFLQPEQIYIEDAANSSINDTSASFTIPYISITSPMSSDTWAPSRLQYITWVSSSTSGNVNITCSDGVSYSTIATEVSANLGTYNWFVPAISSGSYWIYIEDAVNSNINGTSVSFTIPFITVTKPDQCGKLGAEQCSQYYMELRDYQRICKYQIL